MFSFVRPRFAGFVLILCSVGGVLAAGTPSYALPTCAQPASPCKTRATYIIDYVVPASALKKGQRVVALSRSGYYSVGSTRPTHSPYYTWDPKKFGMFKGLAFVWQG